MPAVSEWHRKRKGMPITASNLEKELVTPIAKLIDLSLTKLYNAKELNTISNKAGHYIILANIQVPNRTNQLKWNEWFIWYNGTSSNIRSRIRSHLHRKEKYGTTSGIAVDMITQEQYLKHFDDTRAHNYVKQTQDKQHRYLNGININNREGKYAIATITTDTLANAIEVIFRNEYGMPPLCQYKQR